MFAPRACWRLAPSAVRRERRWASSTRPVQCPRQARRGGRATARSWGPAVSPTATRGGRPP
eukprot:5754784-Lingulodinium_polyedra.AAC.1